MHTIFIIIGLESLITYFKVDENLTEEERKAAWDEFENEKKGFVSFGDSGIQQDVISQVCLDNK